MVLISAGKRPLTWKTNFMEMMVKLFMCTEELDQNAVLELKGLLCTTNVVPIRVTTSCSIDAALTVQ